MNNRIHKADSLKNLADIHLPDERSFVHSRFDEKRLRDNTVEDHYADVAKFQLPQSVPIDVAIAYETAKNLYLYAWHVYRFYPVAEQQALTSLEMGLRMRFSGTLPAGYPFEKKPNPRPTLAPLLRYAIDQGLIRNEGFARWHKHVQQRAKSRVMFEQIDEMRNSNSTVVKLRLEDVTPNAQDLNTEFTTILDKTLPGIRNSYAHGSPRLSNQILGTFELVSEILVQIYPTANESEQSN